MYIYTYKDSIIRVFGHSFVHIYAPTMNRNSARFLLNFQYVIKSHLVYKTLNFTPSIPKKPSYLTDLLCERL